MSKGDPGLRSIANLPENPKIHFLKLLKIRLFICGLLYDY